MGDIDDEDIDLLDLFSNEKRPSSSSIPPRDKRTEHSRAAPLPSKPPPPPPPPLPSSNVSAGLGRATASLSSPPPSGSKPRKSPRPSPPPADFTEAFSGLRVRNRLLSAADMLVRMKGRKVHRLAGLRAVPAKVLESQDPADAWAALGVLVSKSPRRQAANGGSYSIWTLSDLSRKENDVSLFLFQDALSSHWTVCEGTLVAVLGAKVLPDKGDGNAQRMALSVDSPWQINRVGMSMDYGLCKGKRKDGKPCTMPVNKAEGGGYCEFHVVAAFNRAQRKDPLRNTTKGGTSTSSSNINGNRPNSTSSFAASVRQQQQPQQRQGLVQSRAGFPSGSTLPGQRVQAPPFRTAPAHTLASILGAGVRRREGVGATRTFGRSSSSSGVSTVHAKPLRPSALRASGRTTMLSSSAIPAGGGGGCGGRGGISLPRPHSSSSGGDPPRGSRTREGGTAAGPPRAVASAGRNGDGGGGGSCSGKAETGVASDDGEDILNLPWAYGGGSGSGGSGGSSSSSSSKNSEASAGKSRRAMGGGGQGEADAPGPAGKKKEKTTPSGGEGALGGEARPPKEAHPAGFTNGSVVVPAESQVYLQMPQRVPVRQDGSRTVEGAKLLANAQVLMTQRALKHKADLKGLLLRPQDPNAATAIGKKGNIRSSSSSSILGASSKKRTAGRSGANALLGGGSRGGGGDPFAKKVKTLSAVEKELLLRRVSKYAGLAEEERAKDADRSVQRLEQREAMADKAEEVTKMAVTVFDCRQCKTRRSRFNQRCRDLGHDQKGVKAILRFFECTNCRKRCSSTDRVPQTGCESCGRHNMWKRCGARPGRGPADGPRDKRFVAALSEWTDQRDLSLAAPDFR